MKVKATAKGRTDADGTGGNLKTTAADKKGSDGEEEWTDDDAAKLSRLQRLATTIININKAGGLKCHAAAKQIA